RFLLDANRSGVALEINVQGQWHDILDYGAFQSGGYTGTLNAGGPLNGRSAFTGTSIGYPKFITTTVALQPGLSGQTVYFGWPLDTVANGRIGGEYVLDDIVINARGQACRGNPVLPTYCDDGNVCTDDTCNTLTGCIHAANTAPCSLGA